MLQQLARRKHALFLRDPALVRFKRITDSGYPPFYSVRVNDAYRAVGFMENDTIYWVWIGKHDEYLRFLRDLH